MFGDRDGSPAGVVDGQVRNYALEILRVLHLTELSLRFRPEGLRWGLERSFFGRLYS